MSLQGRLKMAELPQTPMIQGEKIWLRAMEKRDLAAFSRGRNDLRIGYEAGYYFPESMTSLEKWYENLISERYGKDGFYLTICRQGSDEIVGFAWLWHLNYKDGNAEFSIFLADTEVMGKGLGTDALNAILDFGFNHLPLERVYLVVRAGSKGAVRSYEKAGMIVEGTLRKAERYRGKLVDQLLMSILRDEWEGLDRRGVAKTSD
jgi:RimJ/RimL family protein N-acetyltransferase